MVPAPVAQTRSGGGINLALALLSASTLAFEILLSRLFALQQFYHFAFLVISLALLGFAASGVALSTRRPGPPSYLAPLAYALSALAAYLVINLLPFDSYALAWDWRQWPILIAYLAAAALPFFSAGWFIGASLSHAGAQAHRPYAANMLGSALGGGLALLLLETIGAEGGIMLCAALGALAGLWLRPPRPAAFGLSLAAGLLILLSWRLPPGLRLRLSPYKPLSLALLAPDARLTLQRWSISGRVDVVESNTFHTLPGYSLNAPLPPPEQAGLFLDGDGPSPLSRIAPDSPQARGIAAHMPTHLAYRLRPGARVLLLRPGGGMEAWIALASGAQRLALAADQPAALEVLLEDYGEFTHHLLADPRLRVLPGATRAALAQPGQYDLVVFALSEGFHPVTSGAFSLTEDFALTRQAFQAALARLGPHGLLVVTRWLNTPPSDSARAWATLLSAMDAMGWSNPGDRLIAFRGMRTATIMASRQPFSASELAEARQFLEANAFDPIHLPDLRPQELNRYNRLPQDTYHQLFRDLLQDRGGTLASYTFNISPPSDERPFYHHFFRWRQTPQVIAQMGYTAQPFGGSGYLVILALLGAMLVLALPLAGLPVLLLRKQLAARHAPRRTWVYFVATGAGFIILEIAWVLRLTLPLEQPALAFSLMLVFLLLSSALGSLHSQRIPLGRALRLLLLLLLVQALGAPALIDMSLWWSRAAKISLAALFLLPAGYLMGVPFAAGLRALQRHNPGWIPWAWALNGAASGIAGVLATMLAIDLGISAAFGAGIAAYGLALLTRPRQG
jgi:hypothetical protein